MPSENEEIIRRAYQRAEDKDIEGWVDSFTPDGTFTDQSIGVLYSGPDELGQTVENYALAFPDMHRELYRFYMDAPCADVFELVGGKIKRFDCYPSGTVVLTQLGVLENLSAAFE